MSTNSTSFTKKTRQSKFNTDEERKESIKLSKRKYYYIRRDEMMKKQEEIKNNIDNNTNNTENIKYDDELIKLIC
jgi:hypothetical protein